MIGRGRVQSKLQDAPSDVRSAGDLAVVEQLRASLKSTNTVSGLVCSGKASCTAVVFTRQFNPPILLKY